MHEIAVLTDDTAELERVVLDPAARMGPFEEVVERRLVLLSGSGVAKT